MSSVVGRWVKSLIFKGLVDLYRISGSQDPHSLNYFLAFFSPGIHKKPQKGSPLTRYCVTFRNISRGGGDYDFI